MAEPITATARYDAGAHRLRLTFAGPVDGAAFRACMEAWLRETPEAAAADWLCDLRGYGGSVTEADVAAFARAYDALVGTSDAGALAVFVTSGPDCRFWVQGCAHALARRRKIMAASLAEAEALLRAHRAPAH